MKTILIFLVLFLSGNTYCRGQYLLEGSRQQITLKDKLEVEVYAARDCKECFYYLPANVRPSINAQGTPEISFISWKDDQNKKTIGAILHFLITWGLTSGQEAELQNKIRTATDSNAVVMGAITMNQYPGQPDIYLEGDDAITDIFKTALTSKSQATTTPGAKMAMSFKFDGAAAERAVTVINDPKKLETLITFKLTCDLLDGPSGLPVTKTIKMQIPLKLLLEIAQKR